MRKLIVCAIMSLDGYVAGPGDDVMAMAMVPAFEAYDLARMRAADTVPTGRRTYEGFESFWPPAQDDPLVRARLEGERGAAGPASFDAASAFVRPEDGRPGCRAARTWRRSSRA